MAGYYFNLPPITALTASQQAALEENHQIALSGGPGTGKSVVSLWRHIQKRINNKNTFLVTYTSTLARYLSACARLQNKQAATSVGKAYKSRHELQLNNFDEVIIDEAQDLGSDPKFFNGENYYDGINSPISYGADDSQILYPNHCSNQNELRQRFPNNIEQTLSRNFRSTQSIMLIARECFRDAYIPHEIINGLSDNVGDKPIFVIYSTLSEREEKIINIINDFHADNTHNIAILLPFKNDVIFYENLLSNNRYKLHKEGTPLDQSDFSIYYEDRVKFPNGCAEIMNIHITTFKSAKGLEFDTVIIPDFQKYEEICGQYNINWQDYYVACTRAKSNLYLISNTQMPRLDFVVEK